MLAAPIRILAVAALAIALLIGLVVRESMARDAGKEVILRMEAVDPRAVLTGHYVVISLTEVLPAGKACPPGTGPEPRDPRLFLPGAPTWVALAPSGDHYAVAGLAESRGQALRLGPLAARGEAWCDPPSAPGDAQNPHPGAMRAKLGVERFHVAQAEAERIDALMRTPHFGEPGPVQAILSVGDDGVARLKGLVVEGKRVELSLL